jgi:surface antigen
MIAVFLPGLVTPVMAYNEGYPYANAIPNTQDDWNFFTRNCTSYVAWKINRDFGAFLPQKYFVNDMTGPNGRTARFGHANNWDNAATQIGYLVDTFPQRGDIAVWEYGSSALGHVAYVESVNADKSVNISEYSSYQYNYRTYVRADKYIHITNYYKLPYQTDFDGDGKKDVTIFRASENNWYTYLSTTGQMRTVAHGGYGDVPVPGDYDGDGKDDFAIFRANEHNWYIYLSTTGQLRTVTHGGYGDIPVPGDYDGDGKTDVAIFRRSDGNWYIINSSTGQMIARHHGGGWEDIPIPADFDGDGKVDITIFRPGEHNWYAYLSTTGQLKIVTHGGYGDVPIADDYDADGKDDYAIFEQVKIIGISTLEHYRADEKLFTHGGYGVVAVPGDYDGDQKSDYAIFRASEHNWYIYLSTTGQMKTVTHGGAKDLAL